MNNNEGCFKFRLVSNDFSSVICVCDTLEEAKNESDRLDLDGLIEWVYFK